MPDTTDLLVASRCRWLSDLDSRVGPVRESILRPGRAIGGYNLQSSTHRFTKRVSGGKCYLCESSAARDCGHNLLALIFLGILFAKHFRLVCCLRGNS